MSDEPDYIEVGKHRDLDGRRHTQWIRRVLLVVFLAVVALGLANVFGQEPTTSNAQSAAARLEVEAPQQLRSGLLYQARFRIQALTAIDKPTLILDSGWLENMTVNTIEPQPAKETSDGRHLFLQLDRLDPGREVVLYIYYQVNPPNPGRRSQGVRLADGSRTLIAIHRTVTVFP